MLHPLAVPNISQVALVLNNKASTKTNAKSYPRTCNNNVKIHLRGDWIHSILQLRRWSPLGKPGWIWYLDASVLFLANHIVFDNWLYLIFGRIWYLVVFRLQLATQDYSACIRTERGYCSISYTQVELKQCNVQIKGFKIPSNSNRTSPITTKSRT